MLIFQETYLSNNMTRKNISENSIILVDGRFNLTFYNFYPYLTNIMVAAAPPPPPNFFLGGGNYDCSLQKSPVIIGQAVIGG